MNDIFELGRKVGHWNGRGEYIDGNLFVSHGFRDL
jgi:hypothetical protein